MLSEKDENEILDIAIGRLELRGMLSEKEEKLLKIARKRKDELRYNLIKEKLQNRLENAKIETKLDEMISEVGIPCIIYTTAKIYRENRRVPDEKTRTEIATSLEKEAINLAEILDKQ